MNATLTSWLFGAMLIVYPAYGLYRVCRGARGKGSLRDRGDILTTLVGSLLVLMIVRAFGEWDVLPPVVWLGGLLLTALTAACGVVAWPRLPWLHRGGWRPASVAIELVLCTAVIVVLY
jgi:hypothetical protein